MSGSFDRRNLNNVVKFDADSKDEVVGDYFSFGSMALGMAAFYWKNPMFAWLALFLAFTSLFLSRSLGYDWKQFTGSFTLALTSLMGAYVPRHASVPSSTASSPAPMSSTPTPPSS